MSKGLEAFDRILGNDYFNVIITSRTNGKKQFANDVNIVRKNLTALEIIKNKCVDCWAFISDISVTSEEESVYAFSPIDLTQEEVDLLKEVLL